MTSGVASRLFQYVGEPGVFAWPTPETLTGPSFSEGGASPPAFVSASEASTAILSSRSPAKPAGVVTADVMLALVTIPSATGDPTGPGDWSQVGIDRASSDSICSLFYKVAGPSEGASYVFSDANEVGGIAVVVAAWRGVNPVTPIGDEAGAAHTFVAEFTCGPVTPSVAGSLLVMFLSNITAQVFSPPGGMTERHASSTAVTIAYVWDELLAGTDPISRTSTGGGAANGASFLVALTPVGG